MASREQFCLPFLTLIIACFLTTRNAKTIICNHPTCRFHCHHFLCANTTFVCTKNVQSCHLECSSFGCFPSTKLQSLALQTQVNCNGKQSCNGSRFRCGLNTNNLLLQKCTITCKHCQNTSLHCLGSFANGCLVKATNTAGIGFRNSNLVCHIDRKQACVLACGQANCMKSRFECISGHCRCVGKTCKNAVSTSKNVLFEHHKKLANIPEELFFALHGMDNHKVPPRKPKVTTLHVNSHVFAILVTITGLITVQIICCIFFFVCIKLLGVRQVHEISGDRGELDHSNSIPCCVQFGVVNETIQDENLDTFRVHDDSKSNSNTVIEKDVSRNGSGQSSQEEKTLSDQHDKLEFGAPVRSHMGEGSTKKRKRRKRKKSRLSSELVTVNAKDIVKMCSVLQEMQNQVFKWEDSRCECFQRQSMLDGVRQPSHRFSNSRLESIKEEDPDHLEEEEEEAEEEKFSMGIGVSADQIPKIIDSAKLQSPANKLRSGQHFRGSSNYPSIPSTPEQQLQPPKFSCSVSLPHESKSKSGAEVSLPSEISSFSQSDGSTETDSTSSDEDKALMTISLMEAYVNQTRTRL